MKVIRIALIAIGTSLILTGSSSSQSITKITPDWYCDYYGTSFTDDIYSFRSGDEAMEAVSRIVEHTGIEQNFVIYASNVPNASATIIRGKRTILYNQDFIRRIIASTQTDWAAISILAHEIGHHLQGHTLQSGGSRPPIELEADKYSGFVLQKMGATLEEAQVAMQVMSSDQGSATHPPKTARLAAITNGWMNAEALSERTPDIRKVPQKGPTSQSPVVSAPSTNPSGSSIQYVARCVFLNDPNAYYVTSMNDIVGVTSSGEVRLVGKRIASNHSAFEWMYQTFNIAYGVGRDGWIYTYNSYGVPVTIGYVTIP